MAKQQSQSVVNEHDTLWGDLRRTRPLCDKFGLSRGMPVDRYYIEKFLTANRRFIRGRVLEIGDSTYTRKFGGDHVERSDVLLPPPGGRGATVVADLATGVGVDFAVFDCILLTQTLEFIYDCRSALRNTLQMLKSDGTLLLTAGAIGHISRWDKERWGDYWRFTPDSLRAMIGECTEGSEVQIQSHGNAPSATAFLHGLAAHEVPAGKLESQDPRYAIVLTARVTRSGPSRQAAVT